MFSPVPVTAAAALSLARVLQGQDCWRKRGRAARKKPRRLSAKRERGIAGTASPYLFWGDTATGPELGECGIWAVPASACPPVRLALFGRGGVCGGTAKMRRGERRIERLDRRWWPPDGCLSVGKTAGLGWRGLRRVGKQEAGRLEGHLYPRQTTARI